MSKKLIDFTKVKFSCIFCKGDMKYDSSEARESYWAEFYYECSECGQGVKLIDRQ